MNQSELIDAVAAASGQTKAVSSKVVNELFAKIADALAKGEEVRVPGFGIFEVSERAARQGRNPQTGAAIEIAAAKAPKFKPAKQLRDAVNA